MEARILLCVALVSSLLVGCSLVPDVGRFSLRSM